MTTDVYIMKYGKSRITGGGLWIALLALASLTGCSSWSPSGTHVAFSIWHSAEANTIGVYEIKGDKTFYLNDIKKARLVGARPIYFDNGSILVVVGVQGADESSVKISLFDTNGYFLMKEYDVAVNKPIDQPFGFYECIFLMDNRYLWIPRGPKDTKAFYCRVDLQNGMVDTPIQGERERLLASRGIAGVFGLSMNDKFLRIGINGEHAEDFTQVTLSKIDPASAGLTLIKTFSAEEFGCKGIVVSAPVVGREHIAFIIIPKYGANDDKSEKGDEAVVVAVVDAKGNLLHSFKRIGACSLAFGPDDKTLWMGDGSSQHYGLIEEDLAGNGNNKKYLLYGETKSIDGSDDPNDYYAAMSIWMSLSPNNRCMAITVPLMTQFPGYDGTKLFLIDLANEKHEIRRIKDKEGQTPIKSAPPARGPSAVREADEQDGQEGE